MTKAQLVDFSTARCDVQYGYVYITGTIIHPEIEWHLEGDATCTIISQHEMLANDSRYYISGDKHYITLRIDLSGLTQPAIEIEDGPCKIVQGDKYQSLDGVELLILLMPALVSPYVGTGKSITLEFGSFATPSLGAAVIGNPNIQLQATYDYTHPFIIKAPYNHRLELQIAHPDLEIRTITKYKPAWHNADQSSLYIMDVNLAEAQIASFLINQIRWVANTLEDATIFTVGASGVLYWLTLSQEGRAKLNQSATYYNAPLTVRDVTAGITLQVPLYIGADMQ